MKKFLLLLAFLYVGTLSAQSQKPEERVRLELISAENGVLVKYFQLDINGKTIQEGQYLDGKPHGIWKMYHSDGSTSTMRFKNGKRIVMNTIINGKITEIFYEDNKPVAVNTKL